MNYIFGDRKNINLIACLILFFATSSLVCSDQGIPLEEGVVFTFIFEDVPLVGTSSSSRTDVGFSFSNGFGGPEKCEVAFYEDINSTSPYYTAFVQSPYYPNGEHNDNPQGWSYSFHSSSTENWQADHEGKITIKLLFGEVTLNKISISMSDGEGRYKTTLIAPEHLKTLTSNGTPFYWLARLGYETDWESAAIEDLDNDGFLNWEEYIADTSPEDNLDYLTLGSSNRLLNFQSSTLCVYSIEYCEDLGVGGSWSTLTNNIQGSGEEIKVTPSFVAENRFFRIVAERATE